MIFISVLTLFLINVGLVVVNAETWSYGVSLHQHTGYSTWWGYDGNPFTFDDDCQPRALEGHIMGYSVEELKESALNQGLKWLAFSDHSYCIDSSEFNQVKSDCQNAQDSDFTCLWGEEVSATEIVDDIEAYPSLIDCNVFGIGDNGEAHS